ncbi:MAG TPA: hypothetical protein VKO43_02640 [Candidatus Krumholzibacteriaceae bacterium]|nr:hypothetical protein [Candidatus Krumholzibacteriaceae bacterium]
MKRPKGIGLVSGGLDSIIAVEIMKRENIDLVGLHIINGFDQETMRVRSDVTTDEKEWLREKKAGMSKLFGIDVKIKDVTGGFLKVMLAPKYGYGKNCNPCIDCKIFFLKEAAELMKEIGADFVFTGEVIGQRPMSQRKKAIDLIAARSGLEGFLLRPLSAKVMAETEVEKRGWVKRENLESIQGRSRKRQIALAAEFGVTDYPEPAGGCILTDPNYSRRLKDFLNHEKSARCGTEDIVLLSVGRHLRLNENLKIVVGRNQRENEYIEEKWNYGWLLFAADVPGPTVLVQGSSDRKELEKIASVTARYSDAKYSSEVEIVARRKDEELTLRVTPISDSELGCYLL